MSDQNTSYRFWKRLGSIAAVAMIVLVCALSYLWYDYAYTRPRVSQPDQGRVYALNTHGLIVYLTKEEQFRLSLLQGAVVISGVCFALTVAFALRANREDGRS
jgi:hypothetical protein